MDEDHLQSMRDVRTRVMDIQERLDVRNLSDHDLLIRLSRDSETMVSTLREIKESQSTQTQSLDTRVRALEEAKWMMYGAAAAFGAVAGWIVSLVHR